MTTILIIAIIVFLIYAFSYKKNPTVSSEKYNTPQKRERELIEQQKNIFSKDMKFTTSSSTYKFKDDSIIDITGGAFTTNNTNGLKKYTMGVPYWAHHYVYSYAEINYTSSEQKRFYNLFKINFLNGTYFDLEGNTNYAFILLFDLLEEYEIHKDISKLENQLRALGQYYPKTKSYGISFLIKIMESKGNREGISSLRSQNGSTYQNNYDAARKRIECTIENESRNYMESRGGSEGISWLSPQSGSYAYQNNYTDYDYWRPGSKYKEKLSLTDEQVELLNKLWNQKNNFCNIEYCYIEILKIYVKVIAALQAKYVEDGTTLDQEFSIVADVVARKHFRYRKGSNNYKYCLESTTNEFYSIIFKYCENLVRESYGHKRKINTDTYYTSAEAKMEFENRIITKVIVILPTLVSDIATPDEATEIELNAQNTTRWRIKFEELSLNYKNNPKQFVDDILSLGNLNKRNPSIENIFFEGSKFIAKSDNEAALILYIHYLYHDLKSATFDNKQLTKTIQKSLFKTNEQLHEFEILVSELINDKNLEKTLQGVSKIYAIKRKKIQLNSTSIKEVQAQHLGTVELLNEYLKDEYEDENNSIKTHEISNEEVEIKITQKNETAKNSIYLDDVAFTQIHTNILEIFEKNNFSVPQIELEAFAKSKGVFKNQLIESINEICYEILDDVLIEDDEEYHTINPSYYQRLLAK